MTSKTDSRQDVLTDREIGDMRSCLNQMGITVWERRDRLEGNPSSEQVSTVTSSPSPGDAEPVVTAATQPAIDTIQPGANKTPATRLLDLPVRLAACQPAIHAPVTLQLVRLAAPGQSTLEPSADELQLLLRMMEAIGLERQSWALSCEVSAGLPASTSADEQLLGEQLNLGGSALVLLLVSARDFPAWHERWQDEGFANSRGAGVIEISQADGGGKVGVAALYDLADLAADGELKRGAWECLKQARQWLSVNSSVV